MASKRPPPKRITLEVLGAPEDRGHVRLASFIRQLDVFRTALRHTDRLHGGGDESGTYWRIVDLSHKSPATVVLEEVRTGAGEMVDERPVVDVFAATVKRINQSGNLPPSAPRDLAVLESYRDLVAVAESQHLASVRIRYAGRDIPLTSKFRTNIDKIIGPDDYMQGSVTGMLEAINLHRTLRCHVYPIVGPAKIACEFEPELKPKIIEAIDKYVRVAGTLKYKQWAPFPHALELDDVQIIEDADAPTLDELRGMAPSATGELSSEDFIEALRDGDW